LPHIENPATFGRFAWVVSSWLRWIPLLQLVPAAGQGRKKQDYDVVQHHQGSGCSTGPHRERTGLMAQLANGSAQEKQRQAIKEDQ
jgi:hypothetical protein